MNLHGLPSLRATAIVANSSGVVCSLPPKPPPTSGAMTRTLDSGMPVVAAIAKRRMCGTWVADHTIIWSPVGSTTVERGSMKAGTRRCWRYSRSMTMPSTRALAIASSTSPPVPCSAESSFQKADLFVPREGCASTVSAAASLRSSTAASSPHSTSTSSTASRAAAAERAATTATISPAQATRSTATGRWVGVTWSGAIGQALMFTPWLSARSAPVNTAMTPGLAAAALVSMASIVAWANGLRTIARCSMPGSWMLSVHFVRPVMRRASSLRLRAVPTSDAGRSSTAVIRPHSPGWLRRLRARSCCSRRPPPP